MSQVRQGLYLTVERFTYEYVGHILTDPLLDMQGNST